MTTQTKSELPEPAGYYYEWDGPYGKRKFSAAPHNGRQCDRAVAYYTADQIRAAIAADRAKRIAGPVLTVVEILLMERRSTATDDETLRFARAIESAVLAKLKEQS